MGIQYMNAWAYMCLFAGGVIGECWCMNKCDKKMGEGMQSNSSKR